MQNLFKVSWFIWLIWHEKGKFAVSCQIKKYLAWATAATAAIAAATGGFCTFHATCQTCQMFLKLFVSTAMGGDIQPTLNNHLVCLYIPPQR